MQKSLRSRLQAAVPARQQGAVRAAFTLVELVVVIVIIGVLAAVAVPRYGEAMSNYRIEAAERRVHADVQMMRRWARSRGEAALIRFDTSSDTYIIDDMPGLIDRRGESYRVRLSDPPYSVRLISTTFDGDAIRIDGRGRLIEEGDLVCRLGSRERVISITEQWAEDDEIQISGQAP